MQIRVHVIASDEPLDAPRLARLLARMIIRDEEPATWDDAVGLSRDEQVVQRCGVLPSQEISR